MREAIIRLTDRQLSALGLDDVIAAARDAGLVNVTEFVCEGPGGIHQIRVAEPIPEPRLDSIDAIAWWERLADATDGVTYLWKVRPPDTRDDSRLAQYETAQATANDDKAAFEVSVIGPRDGLGESLALLDSGEANAYLQRMIEPCNSTSPIARLTERQEEILRVAYRSGYYDVPRSASAKDIAAEVSLDPSTVAEHLQRAERNIMRELFDSPR